MADNRQGASISAPTSLNSDTECDCVSTSTTSQGESYSNKKTPVEERRSPVIEALRRHFVSKQLKEEVA